MSQYVAFLANNILIVIGFLVLLFIFFRRFRGKIAEKRKLFKRGVRRNPNPDEMPDLSPILRRARLQAMLAGTVLLFFLMLAFWEIT